MPSTREVQACGDQIGFGGSIPFLGREVQNKHRPDAFPHQNSGLLPVILLGFGTTALAFGVYRKREEEKRSPPFW